jgi:signal transduction histidine kinase
MQALRRAGQAPPGAPPVLGAPWPRGLGLAALLVVLFLAVAAGAFPVVRRLTRRLENLKQGVQRFGEGALAQRVDASGRDEVAAVAASFNQAAERIEALVASHKNLLANASHELRSPLARMKMALSLLDEAPDGPQRQRLLREVQTNIGELDALVEEVLLASRLDAQAVNFTPVPVEVVSLAAEEASRVGAELQTPASELTVQGDERLLRRALRNLLENARRYGTTGGNAGEITLHAARLGAQLELRVCDRGPGVPEALRERIFEPFFRLPGHAEREGGVGLGLALVKQIAQRHGGSVRCEPHLGGGSCFVLSLPAQA